MKKAQRPERKRVTMERTFRATLAEVWELWTTKEGIESWWGPDGFRVIVQRLELRPGGVLEYSMNAAGEEQIAALKKVGMPASHLARLTFEEIVPEKRLAYVHAVDFIPGVEPYDGAYLVELFPQGDEVRMVLSFEAMHDERWTGMAVAGWEQELGKLERLLDSRR
jgi:uncharacterized protein YndB with AHSA1/START domain